MSQQARSHGPTALAVALTIIAAAGRPAPCSLLDDANAAYTSGRVEQAVRIYKKAVSAGDNAALCYFNLANAYFQLDSVPQSIVYYRASLTYAPEFFRGHLNLAVAYYTLDDIGSCIAAVSRALELEPDNTKARLILAASYRKTGDLPLAVVAFEQLAEKNPEMEEPCIALGEIYRELGDNDEALRWLNAHPDAGKNKGYVLQLLADIHEQRQDYARELYCLTKAAQADPNNRWLAYRIVVTNEKMGNDLVALDAAKDGLAQFPDFGDLALTAGNIAFRHAGYGEAERFYALAKKCGSAGGVVGLENVRQMRAREGPAQ